MCSSAVSSALPMATNTALISPVPGPPAVRPRGRHSSGDGGMEERTGNHITLGKLRARVPAQSKISANLSYSCCSDFYRKDMRNTTDQRKCICAKSGLMRIGEAKETFTGILYLRREEVGWNFHKN